MRHAMLSAALTAALVGCGSSSDSTGPVDPPPLGPLTMAVVGGNAQEDTVTHLLPEPVEVAVTQSPTGRLTARVVRAGASLAASGTPVVGQVVSFVVIDSGCGRPFAGAAATDSLGHVKERWVLGTKAGLCRMEARAVDQTTGEALTLDTATAVALPGPVDTLRLAAHSLLLFAGTGEPISSLVTRLADRYGNAVPAERLSATVSAGLSISGDSVYALEEGAGVLRLSVDAIQDSIRVAGIDDLSAHRWTISYRCAGWSPGPAIADSVYSPAPDSEEYRLTSTSVTYPDGAPPVLDRDGVNVRIVWAITQTRWWPDSTQVFSGDAFQPSPMPLVQWADSLGGNGYGTFVRTSSAPVIYTATHSWCDPKRWSTTLRTTTLSE